MNQALQTIENPTSGVWTEIASQGQIDTQLESRLEHEKGAISSFSEVFALAVKANIGVSGFTRSAGCQALAGAVESVDAPVVMALRAAGAVVVGMTNMHELAFGITSNNHSYGSVALPGHESRSAGGSSGGSAAAVAEASVEIALGTDTGGSVSLPASHCGVFGFRPTTGRWPTAGVIGLSWTRDTPGVITRTLQQAAQVDTWVTGEASIPFSDKPLRLGVPRQFMYGLDPHTSAAFDAAIAAVDNHATIVEIDYAPILDLTGPAEMPTVLWESKQLLGSVAAEILKTTPDEGFERLAHQVTSPDVAVILQSQRESPITATEYRQAQRDLTRARVIYSNMLSQYNIDALIFPTAPAPAPPLNTTDSVDHLGKNENAFYLHTSHTGQGTMLAAPMMTIPLPVAEKSPPIGLTVQGPRFADRILFGIARRLNL